MDQDNRIAMLEKQVEKLQSDLKEVILRFLNIDGGNSAFQQATLAMLMSTPPNPLLDKVLPDLLSRREAATVDEVMAETVVDGMQDAQALILATRAEAHRLYAGTEDQP